MQKSVGMSEHWKLGLIGNDIEWTTYSRSDLSCLTKSLVKAAPSSTQNSG